MLFSCRFCSPSNVLHIKIYPGFDGKMITCTMSKIKKLWSFEWPTSDIFMLGTSHSVSAGVLWFNPVTWTSDCPLNLSWVMRRDRALLVLSSFLAGGLIWVKLRRLSTTLSKTHQYSLASFITVHFNFVQRDKQVNKQIMSQIFTQALITCDWLDTRVHDLADWWWWNNNY